MTEVAKRQAIREFFTAPRPMLHPGTLVVGGCLAFLGLLSGVSGDVGTGILAMAAGAAVLLFLPARTRAAHGEPENEAQYLSLLRYPAARDRYLARVDADQVTAWLLEDLERAQKTSAEILGLDETTRDPICVVGPLYSASVAGIDADLVLRRRVPDGYLYSTYRVSVFQFTDSFLGYYRANCCLIEGTMAAEQTGELFYRDVVAVRTLTSSSHEVLKSGERLERSTTFSLTTKGGDRIEVLLDDPAIRAGDRMRSLGEEAVSNIRAMVRQFKSLPLE